jgi:hypothetical protein
MTNEEIMAALRSDTPLNRARAAFSNSYAEIEAASLGRRPPGPVELRGMEFDAVKRIAEALGMEALQKVASEILEIMDTYDNQTTSPSGIGTPGGLEHMGDVWRLLRRWCRVIKGEAA